MKNIQKIKLFVEATVVVAVALAFIMPGSAVLTTGNETHKDTTYPFLGKNVQKYDILKAASYRPSEGMRTLADGEDIQLTGGWNEGDDVVPSITLDQEGRVVVSWTNEVDAVTSNMGFVYAENPTDPAGWLGGTYFFDGGATQLSAVDTAYVQGPEASDYKGLYGALLGLDTEQGGCYVLPDITDNTGWQFFFWTDPCPDPAYTAVADGPYYYQPNSVGGTSPYWGPVNMYIYRFNLQGYDIGDCPVYVNYNIRGGEGASSVFYYDAQTRLKSAPASDPDMAGLDTRFHLAWQYHNATLGVDQIVWKKIDPAIEADIEYTPFQKYVGFGTHPAIAGENSGKIAIVYMTNDGKVNCTYSGNDGDAWSTVTVTTGTYPDIYYRYGKFYATYIDTGNLYIVNSTDGAAWGTPTRINDVDGTVVAEENSVDLHEGGIVWVDSRGDDKDLYYQQIFPPIQRPDLVISIKSGIGLGVKADITNNGSAAATNVSWQIKVIGGPFTRVLTDKTGTIESIAVGATETVSTGMFFGLGKIAITANVDCDEGSSAQDTGDGFQFFIITFVN